MARAPRTDASEIYRCVEAFAIYRDNVPVVFANGAEVMGSDPILKTHRSHFQPAVDLVLRRQGVEQATAEPGELRELTHPTEVRNMP